MYYWFLVYNTYLHVEGSFGNQQSGALRSVGARCITFEGSLSALSGRSGPDASISKAIFRIRWSVGARYVSFKSYVPHFLVGRCQMRYFWKLSCAFSCRSTPDAFSLKLFSTFSCRSAPHALVLEGNFRILWSVAARCVSLESYFLHILVGRRQIR